MRQNRARHQRRRREPNRRTRAPQRLPPARFEHLVRYERDPLGHFFIRQRRQRRVGEPQTVEFLAAVRASGHVLGNARLGVKNRENMRFARTRIYGLLRELLRALGEDFAAEKILDARDDIFYLTIDEVWDFIRGRAVTTSLRPLAARPGRREQPRVVAGTRSSWAATPRCWATSEER